MTGDAQLLVRSFEPYLITIDPTDEPYEDGTITDVEPYSDGRGWSVTSTSGWSLGCPALPVLKHGRVIREPIVPKVGDRLRVYGAGVGYPFSGIQINDDVVFYRDFGQRETYRRLQREIYQAENARRYAVQKPQQDAEYEALPTFFKKRIDRMRAESGESFRMDEEQYEMFCCTEAVKIANHLRPTLPDCPAADDISYVIEAFFALPSSEQKGIIEDGHSGNTFGGSCMLAKAYLTYTMTNTPVEV